MIFDCTWFRIGTLLLPRIGRGYRAIETQPHQNRTCLLERAHGSNWPSQLSTGRKAWLSVGSDDHGTSAGHLFSLIASARLHRLDPEKYLRDLFRVLGQWSCDRYLELAPKYWVATRASLNPVELANEVGPLTIPPVPQGQSPSR